MGIKNKSVNMETKKTPPPTPAITLTNPEKKPNIISKEITSNEYSIYKKSADIS